MSHANFIKVLGGPTALARILGIADKAPLHWGARGIPALYWHQIEDLPVAKEHGITAKLLHDTRPAGTRNDRAVSSASQAAA